MAAPVVAPEELRLLPGTPAVAAREKHVDAGVLNIIWANCEADAAAGTTSFLALSTLTSVVFGGPLLLCRRQVSLAYLLSPV